MPNDRIKRLSGENLNMDPDNNKQYVGPNSPVFKVTLHEHLAGKYVVVLDELNTGTERIALSPWFLSLLTANQFYSNVIGNIERTGQYERVPTPIISGALYEKSVCFRRTGLFLEGNAR